MLANLLFSSHCGKTYIYQTNIIGKRGNSRLLLPKGQGVCGSDATFCNKKEITTEVRCGLILYYWWYVLTFFIGFYTHYIIMPVNLKQYLNSRNN